MDFTKAGNAGFVQAYVGNALILAICTNQTVYVVEACLYFLFSPSISLDLPRSPSIIEYCSRGFGSWNALSYANVVSPLVASFSLSLALQEDSGQNVKYVVVRTAAVSVGGSLGLFVLYLVYWANGSSFESTVAKGSLFVVLMTSILSTMVYFFRPPIWTAHYKGVLIGGIAVCLVGGDGYWSGSEPLPLILAFVLANMMIGLVTSYVVAHTILPIRKSMVARSEIDRALGLLKTTAGAAVDTIQARAGEEFNRNEESIHMVPAEVGAILIKCRVIIMSSAHMEHRLWGCTQRFPVGAHLKFVVLLRKYLSTYGTLLDIIRNSERITVSQPGSRVLRGLADEIEVSLACFERLFAADMREFGDLSSQYEMQCQRLEQAVFGVMSYLTGRRNEELLQQTRGSSRAVMALLACMGTLVVDMYVVAAECFGDQIHVCIEQRRSQVSLSEESSSVCEVMDIDTFPPHDVPSFKNHRSDTVSRAIGSVISALHLRTALLKAVLQACVATTTATVLLVCVQPYYALGQHALWILITVWVMSAQSTAGAVVLKAVNRVFGTAIAGALSYVVIYLVYLLNGCSYENRALKYVFMTLIYPIPMAFLHRAMIQSQPQWKYGLYVSKVTLAICTLATFGESSPNPSVPAWRLLAVIIGIGIEFVVKTLIFYRESSTSMRHRIQEILELLASGGWQDDRWRAVTANKINELDKLEDLVRFEDKIAAALHLPALFDRRLINAETLPRLRSLLRIILNRVLSLVYLKTSLQALVTGRDVLVDIAVREYLRRAHEKLIPSCLQELAAVFRNKHPQTERKQELYDPSPFDELRATIDEARAISVNSEAAQSTSPADLAQLTWTCGLMSIVGSLATAMEELREFLINQNRHYYNPLKQT